MSLSPAASQSVSQPSNPTYPTLQSVSWSVSHKNLVFCALLLSVTLRAVSREGRRMALSSPHLLLFRGCRRHSKERGRVAEALVLLSVGVLLCCGGGCRCGCGGHGEGNRWRGSGEVIKPSSQRPSSFPPLLSAVLPIPGFSPHYLYLLPHLPPVRPLIIHLLFQQFFSSSTQHPSSHHLIIQSLLFFSSINVRNSSS